MHAPELDPATILTALGVDNTTRVELLLGGADASMWRVETGTARYALRVLRAAHASRWRGEVAAMQAARAAGIPVPEVHTSTVWQGRPALLLSWCAGRTMLAEVRGRPWHAWGLGRAMGRLQAGLHAIDAPTELIDAPAHWLSFLHADDPALYARLQRAMAPVHRMLHFDYHPLNLMTDGAQVTCVVDWANARAGDPRADVARTLTLLRLGPIPPGISSFAPQALRLLIARAWWHGYREAAGPLGDMAPFYAAAGIFMLHDLRDRLTPDARERTRRWVERWKQRSIIRD